VSVLLAFAVVLSSAITVYASDADQNVVITLTKAELEENPASVIEEALKYEKYGIWGHLTVNVPSGTYVMKTGLHIYSNTTLNLKADTVLVRDFSSGSMIKSGTQNDVNSGYNGYNNIIINGGVWDNSFTQTTCCIRFAHCNKVTLKNMTVKNVYDSHHIEIGAASNMTLDNITLTGYKRSKNTSGEAVQIDPVHSSQHFKGYQLLDDTPCKNITVKNCTFTDVFSGVGTRSGVVGSYFDNIKIINNTFTNITDKAICTFNYTNSQIKNNIINGASVGIFFEEYPTKNLTSKLWMPYSSSASKKIITNTNSVISGNSITVSKNAGYAQSCGIGVYGGVLSAATSESTGLKAGKYFANNVTVLKNTVNLGHKASVGIECKYVNSSQIKSNKITKTAATKKNTNAVMLYHCNKNKITDNKISGNFDNGISLHADSLTNTFGTNTVKNTKNYGLIVYGKSNAVISHTNSFAANGKGTICISGKNQALPSIKGKVTVKNNKKNNVVKWQKSATASGYYVYRSAKKNGAFTLVATVKNRNKLSFTDKTSKKYYYKVSPYRFCNKSVLIGRKAVQ